MSRIELLHGDITTLEVDAIVNAANSGLGGGGGVDGAIHRAAGPKLVEECKTIRERQGGCPPGEAVITTGANLKAKFIIHAVVRCGMVERRMNNNCLPMHTETA